MAESGTRRLRRVVILGCLTAGALMLCTGCGDSSTGPDGGAPVTILVDAAGGGDYTTIGAAINASTEGDTILVAPGVYSGDGNRNLDFEGVNITLRAASARESTVIDCGGEGRAFHFHSGETAASVVEGFIIRNGTAAQGGAIRCEGAGPTLDGITFRSNITTREGGAVFCKESSLTMTNVVFTGNAIAGDNVRSGGAIFCDHSSLVIESGVFRENESAGSGGAIGGIFSSLDLSDVTFIGNHASFAGGAILLADADWAREQTSITGAVFLANSAYLGGAISLSGSSPYIARATLARNVGIQGGGFFCQYGSRPSINRTIIAFSTGGGALVCYDDADEPSTTRSCIFGNAGGDDLCGNASENLFTDPLFCDVNEDDVSLCENSQCLAGNNSWGVQIGALGSGCADCGESRR
jgi:predicted outer membrane repeat protein